MSAEALSPGSAEAVAEGCRCPVIDNGHGRGYMGGLKQDGETIYVRSGDCPLHGHDSHQQIVVPR